MRGLPSAAGAIPTKGAATMRGWQILSFVVVALLAWSQAAGQTVPRPDGIPQRESEASPLEEIDPTGVPVVVTAVTGDSVYLDSGRGVGLAIGDAVVFRQEDGSELRLEIESVSRSSARCLLQGGAGLSAGSRGLAFPAKPVAPTPPQLATGPDTSQSGDPLSAPARHPEWTHPPEEWTPDLPLLAPTRALDPRERTTEVRGAFFTQYLHTWNWQFVDNQYSFGRTGLDLWIDNPYGDGGQIRFRGDLDIRGVDLFDGNQAVDTMGRVSLMSYAHGVQQEQPLRYELGRFLPCAFPEFGFLDGVEVILKGNDFHRFGATVGAMPEPFPVFQSWDDLQTSVFYQFSGDAFESSSLGAGYQKSWHQGTPDRDLLVFKGDYHPNSSFYAHGTIWTDYYDDADDLKSSRLQITEALFGQSLRFSPLAGMGTYYVQLRWPQLLRREIDPIFAIQILRYRRSSYGGYVWRDLSKHLRLNGRIDRWENQDDLGGTTGEIELCLRQIGDSPWDVAVAFLTTDGRYVSGPGGRIGLLSYFSRGLASVTYVVGDYRMTDHANRLLNQAVTTSIDFWLPSGHSFNLFGDYRFGDDQDAASIGMVWRKRF